MPSPTRHAWPRATPCPTGAMLLAAAILTGVAGAADADSGPPPPSPAAPMDAALLAIAEDICLDLMDAESTHRVLNGYQLAALIGINPRTAAGETSLTFFDNGIAYCRSGDQALWTSFSIDGRHPPAAIAALESPPPGVLSIWFQRVAPPSPATQPTRLQDSQPAGVATDATALAGTTPRTGPMPIIPAGPEPAPATPGGQGQ